MNEGRVKLRKVGAEGTRGLVVAMPSTLADLLALADAKLFDGISGKAKRVFDTDGDEHCDVDLIESDDILYVSDGADYVPAQPHLQGAPSPMSSPANSVYAHNDVSKREGSRHGSRESTVRGGSPVAPRSLGR